MANPRGRPRKVPLDMSVETAPKEVAFIPKRKKVETGSIYKVGDEVYSCSPNIAEKSFNDSGPQKPQLLKITDIYKKPANIFLVLEDNNKCLYYEDEKNCATSLAEAELLYQKQKKLYGGALIGELIKYVESPELAGQLTKIRKELLGEKD